MTRDEPIPSEPYTSEDLKKPGFDPGAAYHAWVKRRLDRWRKEHPEQYKAYMERRKHEAIELALEPRPAAKPFLTREERSINLWKRALKDAKAAKKRKK